MNNQSVIRTFASVASLCIGLSAFAHAPSGAIFTTLSDGSEVNFNHFPSKEAVYLDGGPGPGAPQHAAGLDDGTYVFQVTDPSGKVLLSTDIARARQFTVVDGIISGVVPTPGQHLTGLDIDHGATTVQLMPYNDTPNNGGVYKVWATRVEDYLLGCQELGVANGLDIVDPGQHGGNRHGFIPGHSKTDNFKVKQKANIEIDTRFFNHATGEILDGLGITWIDTLGASNKKHSYWAPELLVFHEAHVEAVEPGIHAIQIDNGPGYTVVHVHLPDGSVVDGPTTVYVKIPNNINKDLTVFIDVEVDLE
jgi:hypothetical protein